MSLTSLPSTLHRLRSAHLRPRPLPPHQQAAVDAYVRGWRQDDNGHWWRPGTPRDAITLHNPEDDDESEHGYVLASTPEKALEIDREAYPEDTW